MPAEQVKHTHTNAVIYGMTALLERVIYGMTALLAALLDTASEALAHKRTHA